MKPFHTIAVPHDDILEGRLTMDVFAADLWEVAQNRDPDEYRDAETFFKKTYLTQGLDNLLHVVKKRVGGQGGDPIIQIQTPFGGLINITPRSDINPPGWLINNEDFWPDAKPR